MHLKHEKPQINEPSRTWPYPFASRSFLFCSSAALRASLAASSLRTSSAASSSFFRFSSSSLALALVASFSHLLNTLGL